MNHLSLLVTEIQSKKLENSQWAVRDIFLSESGKEVDDDGRHLKMKTGTFIDLATARFSVTGQGLADAIGTKQSNVRTICKIAMDLTNAALNWAKELCKSEESEVMEF